MLLSVIIPTLNEAENIGPLLELLKRELKSVSSELIVVDASSHDQTADLAEKKGAIVLVTDKRSRAVQMNIGANSASGEILYFVHADCMPPTGFPEDILNAFEEGFDMGCFRFKFNSSSWLLKINAFCTRYNFEMFRGGDQTFFIKKINFNKLGGYNEKFKIMEEYDFMRKAKKELKFTIIPKDVIVSARKYAENSYFRVNLANLVIFASYNCGVPQENLVRMYKTLLNHPKPEALE